jgi:tetratricopeptide (TPR) repeat protein
MGDIYVARDRVLGRTVAVKVLAERFAEETELRERFRREALTAARLSGEAHVVTIFDVGEHAGRPFIVMEHLPGGTLGERARSRPVAPERALAWLEQASAALDAAHAKGVVHRDVKPANLLFDGSDRLQVVDFGIARLVDETLGMTAPGTVLGTAGYLAPEQALGRETTAASDRYALAVVAYELLTGGRPFARASETAEAAARLHEEVPPASERGVGLPVAVDAVFARALARDPDRRYPTAASFVDALRDALRPAPAPAAATSTRRLPRRRSPLAALALAGAILFGLAGLGAALVAARGEEPTAAPSRETVTRQVTVGGGPATVVETVTEAAPDPGPAPPPGQERLSPEQAAELNDEAFALMQQGRWEDALPLLERAVPALRRTYSEGFQYEAYSEYNLGRTLEALDRCPEARRHLRRSERLQGEREEITAALERCS